MTGYRIKVVLWWGWPYLGILAAVSTMQGNSLLAALGGIFLLNLVVLATMPSPRPPAGRWWVDSRRDSKCPWNGEGWSEDKAKIKSFHKELKERSPDIQWRIRFENRRAR